MRKTIKILCVCVCVCVCERSGYCTLTIIPLDIIQGQQVTSGPPCLRICSPHRAVWTLSAEKCHPAPFIFMVTHKQETSPVHDTGTFSYLKSFHENEKKKKKSTHQTKQKNLAALCFLGQNKYCQISKAY